VPPTCRFCSFLFSGLFITETSLQWPLRFFMYILPLRWSLASVVRGPLFNLILSP
jgi:hypothetical protein